MTDTAQEQDLTQSPDAPEPAVPPLGGRDGEQAVGDAIQDAAEKKPRKKPGKRKKTPTKKPLRTWRFSKRAVIR